MCLDEIALKGQGYLTVVSVSLIFLPSSKREKEKKKKEKLILKLLPDFSSFWVDVDLSNGMINDKLLCKYTVMSKMNIDFHYFKLANRKLTQFERKLAVV